MAAIPLSKIARSTDRLPRIPDSVFGFNKIPVMLNSHHLSFHSIRKEFPKMNSLNTMLAAASIATMVLAGCGKEEKGATGTTAKNTTGTTAKPIPAAVPASLLLAAKPEKAVSVAEARKTAKPGDTITVFGEIGGRRNGLFSENLATFPLADPTILISCDKECGKCPTPWDYCCMEKEKFAGALLTIQVSDGKDSVLRAPLKGWNGLKELSHVTVTGTVDATSSPEATIINATGIFIEPAAAKPAPAAK
jgi:hypothetical protein